MTIKTTKILSLISSFLLVSIDNSSLVLFFTSAINDSIPQIEGGDIGENISRGCSTVVVVFMAIFAFIAQVFAFLFTLLSVFPRKKKGLVFLSNSFSIVFCVLALFVYFLTLVTFAELHNGSSSATLVNLCFIFAIATDLFGVIVCIISMVVKGKAKNVKAMEQKDLPAPFVVGANVEDDDIE